VLSGPGDISALYTAALLSKVGHSCCVLIPEGLHQVVVSKPGAPVEVPLFNASTGGAVRYQELLDVVQSQTPEERVLFTPVGETEDGYMHTVVASFPPKTSTAGGGLAPTHDKPDVLALRSSTSALVGDLSRKAGLRREEVGTLIKVVADLKGKQAPFLYSKLDPNRPRNNRDIVFGAGTGIGAGAASGGSGTSANTNNAADVFKEHCQGPFYDWPQRNPLTSQIWNQLKSLGPHLGAGTIGVTGEAVPIDTMSAGALLSLYTAADTGVYYPRGGLPAVQEALIRTIRESGGEVYCDVPVTGIDVTPETQEGEAMACMATGVRVRVAPPRRGGSAASEGARGAADSVLFSAGTSVISGVGAICTYTRLLKPEHVSRHVRETLDSSVREAEPRVRVVFWLDGDEASLGLSSCDYVELPSFQGSVNGTGDWCPQLTQAEVNEQFVKVWSPSAKDSSWPYSSSAVVVELQMGSGVFQLESHVWPSPSSAQTQQMDPPSSSSPSRYTAGHPGPKSYVASVDDGSSNTQLCGGPVSLSTSQKRRLGDRARAALLRAYPQVAEAIQHEMVIPPIIGGSRMANTTAKYLCDVDVASEVKGLYLCGADVGLSGLAADVQGGWLAANAVLGYDLKESFFDLGDDTRDVTRDIRNI